MIAIDDDLVVWSLMSSQAGGFIKAHPVVNLKFVSDGVFACDINQNVEGEFKINENYEFFAEQCLNAKQHTFNILKNEAPYRYRQGNPVKVYARQTWGEKIATPINGVVYQDQHSKINSSVIVSVSPLIVNGPINNFGGTTIEVYPQQLRLFEHNENHPIQGARETSYIGNGFALADMYKKKRNLHPF